jgi:hypothetical protein
MTKNQNTNIFNYWGQLAKGAMGVDPSQKYGGIVAGESIDTCQVIPYPRTSEDMRDFAKNCAFKWGVDILTTFFVYERRPVTDKVPGGASRLYQMGVDDGIWTVLSASFHQKLSLFPQTWRKSCFPTLKTKPKGGQAWKQLELKYCKFFTGDRLIKPVEKAKTDKRVKGVGEHSSDHSIYGISAAFCIFLVGLQMAGVIRIENEVKKRKGEIK